MTWEIREGDVLDRLREMPDGSINTCITSPPYWGLRDYGTASWVGGDVECDHVGRRGRQGTTGERADRTHSQQEIYKETCGRCGATRVDKQLGLEPTPEEFISKMVEVFREVKRVLRDDATCWINMGDSYLSQQGKGFNGQKRLDDDSRNNPVKRPSNIKPKDLAGMPWTLALALRDDGAASPDAMRMLDKLREALLADFGDWDSVPAQTRDLIGEIDREWEDAHKGGWFLRSDIIWHKPNPMPESCTDRPTKSHEYIFLLSKRGKYYYDADAIREDGVGTLWHAVGGMSRPLGKDGVIDNSADLSEVRNDDLERPGRNKRDVWTVSTFAYPEAHFATYPPKLIEPCILAGCPEGGTVLDPFSGSGTTGLVALRHGRNYIGIELNPEYAAMSRRRIEDDAPLLNTGSQNALD